MKTDDSGYPTYRGLPPLAGLCSMDRAIQSDWSLDESVTRLKRLHYVLRRLHETLTARITAEPIYELKTAFSHHAYICAEQVTLIRRRVGEMREPPLGLDKIPHPALERLMDEVLAAPGTEALILGVYQVVVPVIMDACERLQQAAHPLADAPTVRVAKLIRFELADVASFGDGAIASLVDDPVRQAHQPWIDHLLACVEAAGCIDGVQPQSNLVPGRWHSKQPYQYANEPRRDERFQDSFNAGVNPEAFLYDEEFSPQDKTLMMYYKRIRELDVPEMMASILVELKDEEPWEFHMEMSRQLWDEARHAMMGEVGFVSQGIDWHKIPINFTWSRNLESAAERSRTTRCAVLHRTGTYAPHRQTIRMGSCVRERRRSVGVVSGFRLGGRSVARANRTTVVRPPVHDAQRSTQLWRSMLVEGAQPLAQLSRSRLDRASQLVARTLPAGLQELGKRTGSASAGVLRNVRRLPRRPGKVG